MYIAIIVYVRVIKHVKVDIPRLQVRHVQN